MSNRGYANLAEILYLRTNKRHSSKQLKNRWDILKAAYNFWAMAKAQIGNSYDHEKDAIIASPQWWAANVPKVNTLYGS